MKDRGEAEDVDIPTVRSGAVHSTTPSERHSASQTTACEDTQKKRDCS